jgi:hypothetical protein
MYLPLDIRAIPMLIQRKDTSPSNTYLATYPLSFVIPEISSETKMTSSDQFSPLLRLPAELRNHIYSYVLGGETFDIHCWRRYTPFGFTTRIIKKRTNFLALLAVNHQIHAETYFLPFHLNAFRFKSQDAFHSWLDKFSVDQQDAIREVHLVTWMARHMVEGEGWRSKALDEVVPLERLPGLRRVEVEVRRNERVRDCRKEGCFGCEDHGDVVEREEEKVKVWFGQKYRRVEVRFERVAA